LFFKLIEVKTKFLFAKSISEFSRNQDPNRTFGIGGPRCAQNLAGATIAFAVLAVSDLGERVLSRTTIQGAEAVEGGVVAANSTVSPVRNVSGGLSITRSCGVTPAVISTLSPTRPS
jgi:hypothetical protein